MPAALLDVDSDVFTSAGQAFLVANDAVCDIVAAAATCAGVGGGMAGADPGAARWAAAYDRGARQALAAGATLADQLGEVGVRLVTGGRNHGDAEQASVPGAPACSGADAVPSPVGVIPASPPPAAGGASSPPFGWSVLAALIPFAWPGGEPDTLRVVGAGWTRAGAALQAAADRLSGPLGDLSAQRSPEVDTAVSRCTDVQLAVRSLAAACDRLGAACTTLAGHLEQTHAELTAAVADVGDLAGAAFGVAAAAVTGDDITERIEKLVATLSAVLDRLKDLLSAAADLLEQLVDEITDLVGRLADLVTTAVTLSFTVAAASTAAVTGIGRVTNPRVDLAAMEGPDAKDGHTIAKHVGKSDDFLKQRAEDEGLDKTSTFDDLAIAESLTAANIAAHTAQIARWLGRLKPNGKLEIRVPAPPDCGRVYVAAANEFVPPTEVVTVLIKIGTGTFVVLTSYLEP